MALADFTVEDVEEYLEDYGVSDDVVTNFRRNRVTGAAFLKLTEDDLRELVPLIGERTNLRDLLKQSKQVCLICMLQLLVYEGSIENW